MKNKIQQFIDFAEEVANTINSKTDLVVKLDFNTQQKNIENLGIVINNMLFFSCYNAYLQNIDAKTVAENIINIITSNVDEKMIQKSKENIFCELVNKNLFDLTDKPYTELGSDLVLVYYVWFSDSSYSMPVTTTIAKSMGLNTKELFQIAKYKTLELFGKKCTNVVDEDSGSVLGTIVTNERESYGAATFFLLDNQEEEYVLVPSSVHELLILPIEDARKKYNSEEAIIEVNASLSTINTVALTQVEVLSDHLYIKRKGKPLMDLTYSNLMN